MHFQVDGQGAVEAAVPKGACGPYAENLPMF